MERHVTRVLLVEDDEDDYILLQKILAKIPDERYELRWERTYTSGLAAMLEEKKETQSTNDASASTSESGTQRGSHDLCLVDYRLGASNGIELLKEARSQGYRLPIVLLTGVGGGEIDIQALQAGADDYIAKEQLQGELLRRILRYAIERKKAEHERERLLSEQIASRELEQRRNEFIGMVVHELKTPLTSLKGYTQLLQRRYASSLGGGRRDEQVAQFAARMDAQITKLTDLIEDFLDVTRIAGGKLQFREGYFAFDALVEEIVQECQMLNGQVGTSSTNGASASTSESDAQRGRQAIRCEGKTNKTIWGDRLRIGQVITNLLSNAMKYAPSSEDIVVKMSSDADTVTLCVQDAGPGIPPALRERVFEPFYRIEQNEQRATPGLGLGLHIAAEIIRRQQGRIWIESENETERGSEGKGAQRSQGATFCFTLPISPSEH